MEDEEKKIKVEERKPTRDAVSHYFVVREKLIDAKDSYSNYELMMESISIGSSLIKDEELKKCASDFLENNSNYPKITDMEYQSNHVYSVGSGTSGTITVRPEDLEIGRQHLLDQQCNNIIPKLRILDNKILSHLINDGIIPKMDIGQTIIKKLKEELDE